MSSFMSRILYFYFITIIYSHIILIENVIYCTNDVRTHYQKYIKILACT